MKSRKVVVSRSHQDARAAGGLIVLSRDLLSQ